MDDNQIKKIKGLLSKEKTIVIIPHKNPDGDAIGIKYCFGFVFKKIRSQIINSLPKPFSKIFELDGSQEKN
jgi:phosphoesterase RecJ-like protein